MPASRARLVLVAALVSALFAPPTNRALANGRFPEANQLIITPGAPNRLVLRTTFGLLVSLDRGARWDWICESAYGQTDGFDPPIAATALSILVGSNAGLAVTADRGCNWTLPLKTKVTDLVVPSAAPTSAFALTSLYVPSDAGIRYLSQLYVTSDAGATFTAQGAALDPMAAVYTLEVAPSDKARIYVSGLTSDASATPVFYASSDGGAHWIARALALTPMDEPFIAAVDPTAPDRVYLRTFRYHQSRLLVSDDAGVTFRSIFASPNPLLGFALSDDGSTIFVGTAMDGLFVARSTDLQFTQRATVAVRCLAAAGGTLYVCSDEANGFSLGASDDGGVTFRPALRLRDIRGALVCSAGSAVASCADLWPAQRCLLTGDCPDGGPAPDAAAELRPAPIRHGCSLGAIGSGSLLITLLVLLATLALALRRSG